MFCGMEELTKISHGDCADGEIIYKGISFNENDVVEIAENDITDRIESDGQTIDDLIEDGVLTEKSRGKDWGNDIWEITNDYLCNQNNHGLILSDMNDMIYSIQTEEEFARLASMANDAFGEEMDCEMRSDAADSLSDFAFEAPENLQKLLDELELESFEVIQEKYGWNTSNKEMLYCYLMDNLVTTEILPLCDRYKIEIQQLYLIYCQNDTVEECFNESQVLDMWKKLTKEYDGLAAVVVGYKGVVYDGSLDIRGIDTIKNKLGIGKAKENEIEVQ